MSIYKDIEPINLSKVKTYELASRPSKVNLEDFAEPVAEEDTLCSFLAKLPNILAVKSLRELAERIRSASSRKKPVIWGIGGHVIKTGLAPLIIDLMDRGLVTALAVNGSVLVHDLEIAIVGFTSEDVDSALGKGDFGAALETGEILNNAARIAVDSETGLGEAVGKELTSRDPANRNVSVLCAAYERGIPVTAHLAIGADIGHFHSSCDGAALGAASHTDFRLLCSLVREMNGGGAYLNYGSAVVLPEIFLKAVTVVKNLGGELIGITTANFDFIQQYRPSTNVVRRPTADGAGKGFSITGHHEFTLPLLAAELICGK